MAYFFLLTFFLSAFSMACEVSLPPSMIVLGDEDVGQFPWPNKNCQDKTLREFHQTLLGLEGRMNSFQLTDIMVSKGHHMTIHPSVFKIDTLKSIIREQLAMPANIHVKRTKGPREGALLSLSAGDRIEVSCPSCLYGTDQPINVTVHTVDASIKTYIASVDFIKLVKAHKLLSPITAFSDIDSTNLKEELVEAVPHTDLVTDLDSLRFYKTNKPLRTGDLLRRSDLNAVNLVKAGLKTDVILENTMIKLKTQGISRGNGTIGELVEIYHPQKNKKYQGKVIDMNKVLVEL